MLDTYVTDTFQVLKLMIFFVQQLSGKESFNCKGLSDLPCILHDQTFQVSHDSIVFPVLS